MSLWLPGAGIVIATHIIIITHHAVHVRACWSWPARAGRGRVGAQIAGAAIVGAVMAAVFTYIWNIALQAESRSCTDTGAVCLGPDFGGIIAGLMVVIGGSLAGFAILRIRPLLVTVPTAILVAYLVATGSRRPFPAVGRLLPGRLFPCWRWASRSWLARS